MENAVGVLKGIEQDDYYIFVLLLGVYLLFKKYVGNKMFDKPVATMM